MILTTSLPGGEEVTRPGAARHTTVSIVGDEFHLNGRSTYADRTWRGHKIQGLLLNARMVQGIFDDRNPETRFPDVKEEVAGGVADEDFDRQRTVFGPE